MKAKLFTKNVCLGVLVAFVLALGVQGAADAVQHPTVADSALIGVTNRKIGADLSFTVPSLTADSDTKADEKVTIKISSGILLTTSGHHGKSTVTLTEDGESGSNLSLSTLAGRFLDDGKQTITVKGTDYNDSDDPEGFSGGSWTLTYVYYVTQPATNVKTATINLANLSSTYKYKAAVYRDISIYGGDSKHYNIQYSPATGLTYKIPGRTDNINVPDSFISSAFKVYLTGDTDSEVITATVENSELSTTGAYFYGQPVLTVTEPTGSDTDGSESNPGESNSLLSDAFSATVAGGESTTALAGILVKFEVSDKTLAGGNLVFTEGDDGANGILVDSSNKQIWNNNARVKTGSGKTLYIRTGSTNAQVDFRLGTAAEQKVTISAVDLKKEVSAFTDVPDTYELSVDEIQDISGKYGLYVLAENAGKSIAKNWDVVFTTAHGAFQGTGISGTDFTPPTDNGKKIVQHTNELGIAYVIFDPKGSSGTLEVTASIKNNANFEADTAVTAARLTFDATDGNGGGGGGGGTASLTITATGTGTTRSVTVAATDAQGAVDPGIFVTLSGTALPGGSQNVSSGTSTTITLPSTPGSYTLTAAASGYTSDTETLTITAPGTLSLEEVGARAATGGQSIRVTVRDSSGALASGAVTVTLSGAVSRTVPTTNGTGAAVITVPTTGGPHTVTLSATGYTTGQVTLSTAGQTTPTPTPTPTPTVSDPSRINIVGPSTRDGTANTELDAALIVQVVDEDGTAVPDARVIFRVRKGQGKLSLPGLSPRGNGRAVGVQTDSQGYGRAAYTPISASSTVEAEARGVTRSVTFTITASGGTAAPTTPDTGTGTTPGAISPVVHVGAAQRPPMLWVDSGAIYALVGKEVQKFAPGVDNANNIAVGGGKVYWTEKTGESSGTINSANLNGSNVQELASILAVPMGIAVSSDKLYWTNSRGRIQSANLDGSGITNVIPGGLEGAMDIALAGGNAYWTQGGNVRFVNLRGQKQIRNISTGTDTAGSLAIGGGKVYWTEMTGESGGTVNSANLNGTGAKQLASILAAPSGIAVDGARSKLYWGNARGRIQSANLDGSKIQNVVSGLGSPGDMVLSNSITAPTATTTTTKTTTARSKYDVNGDGRVDNTDAGLVADAQGTSNAKYDVNGDGRVNFLDLLLVFDNRDDDAAGAPTVLGMKLSAAQVDILQEQIDLLIATGDRSPAAMRTLVYLQQLIATARPEKTQLLANYPNPFNPETWIPYELADATQVKITIYNAQGVVIRTLQLGQQSAGYYTDRERAAYWDGRNAVGEQVASGIYFYQLETDEMSSLRKMVILK